MQFSCTKNHEFTSTLGEVISLYPGIYDVQIIKPIVKINGHGNSQTITKTEFDSLVELRTLIRALI